MPWAGNPVEEESIEAVSSCLGLKMSYDTGLGANAVANTLRHMEPLRLAVGEKFQNTKHCKTENDISICCSAPPSDVASQSCHQSPVWL
nr:hypothetical protein HmN_001000300 [Hymenolepis microstoma]CDS35161.1 hypothetical protein HmN_001000500 [Hymenolepis microstoma]